MNPLRVTATNYRTFERLDVDLPTGVVAIAGPNGAGKSSILNLVDVTLFAGRGELPPLLALGEDELELSLEFEHAGELYRVRRQYSARGRGKTTCDFEVWNDRDDGLGPDVFSGWHPLTRETSDETQKLICQTLGLSRETFRASSFLRQGDGAAFTEAQPRDRKAILAEILGLDVWDRLLEHARTDLRNCENELLRADALIGSCKALVEQKDTLVVARAAAAAQAGEVGAVVVAAEVQLEEATRAHAAAAAVTERVRGCEAALAAALDNHQRAIAAFAGAQQAAEQLADKTIELGELAADADRVPQLEQQAATMRAAAVDADTARARKAQLQAEGDQRDLARGRLVDQALAMHDDARALRGKADHLDAHIDEAATCDRCAQTLGAEAAARAAASFRAEATQLDEKAAAIDASADADLAAIAGLREQADAIEVPDVDDPAAVERDLAACRRAAEQRAAVAEQVRQLTDRSAQRVELERELAAAAVAVDEKQTALAAAKADLVDVAVLDARVASAKVAVSDSRAQLEQLNGQVARLDGDLARVADAERQLAEHRTAVEETQKRVDLLRVAERAYGRDGIPALIVENAAIPQLELEANRILGELGGSTAGCRVELRTQRALKTTEALRETLDIVIVTPKGEMPYESFSGGERTRLNLALRIALARLLAHRRGAESRLLAIDEPEFLDEHGTARLGEVLRGLSGDFDRILLVSHHPTLATAFDTTIAVTKDGDRSRVGDLVAVAA